MITAVFFGHVMLDLITTPGAKVDIEVRKRFAFGVQETFKQQAVLERVKVGNSHRVCRD